MYTCVLYDMYLSLSLCIYIYTYNTHYVYIYIYIYERDQGVRAGGRVWVCIGNATRGTKSGLWPDAENPVVIALGLRIGGLSRPSYRMNFTAHSSEGTKGPFGKGPKAKLV